MMHTPYISLSALALTSPAGLALYRRATLQAIEAAAAAQLAPHTLMQQAGAALYRFLCAQFPQAQRIWFICGTGNNGGDALVAACLWQQEASDNKRSAIVTTLSAQRPDANALPDAAWAWDNAQAAGLHFCSTPPSDIDVIVDAIWGIGFRAQPSAPQTPRPVPPLLTPLLQHLQHVAAGFAPPIVAVDLPSGLDADSGVAGHRSTVRAQHTLAMLALKPGYFTADGLDHCGRLHLATLGIESLGLPAHVAQPDALCQRQTPPLLAPRLRNSHKGDFGNVVVVGGATGMGGALLLASSAALCAGAGRVWAVSADAQAAQLYETWPEIMLRPWPWENRQGVNEAAPNSGYAGLPAWSDATVLCGCGAGVGAHTETALQQLIPTAARLVLDADAINTLARSMHLQQLLQARAQQRPGQLLLTPHPLEAARLLACDVAAVQADRLHAAQRIAHTWHSVCVLKGAGTVIAAPDATAQIWPVGNAKLAQAGSGDVLAGYVAAVWAELGAGAKTLTAGAALAQAQLAAAWAVSVHGHVAETWPKPHLRAQDLAIAMGHWTRHAA